MKTGGLGGSKTLTGLKFEDKVDFQKLLTGISGYSITKIPNKAGRGVYFEGDLVARWVVHQYYLQRRNLWKHQYRQKDFAYKHPQ